MGDIDSIVRLGGPSVKPEASKPNNVVSGDPQQSLANYYADGGEKFFAGIWESTPGKWRVSYSEHEFCHILAGKLVLADERGGSVTFKAGDAFVIPAGFAGTWETVEPVRKLYAIYQA